MTVSTLGIRFGSNRECRVSTEAEIRFTALGAMKRHSAARYSITSSAMARSVRGTVMPSAFAVTSVPYLK
jgi:hypothetical protein